MASAGTVDLDSIRHTAAGKAAAKMCLDAGNEADAVELLRHKNSFVKEGSAMALAEAYLASEREGDAIALLTNDEGAPAPCDPEPCNAFCRRCEWAFTSHSGAAEVLVVAYLAAGREADAVALLKHDDLFVQIGGARALVEAYMAAGREADVIAFLKDQPTMECDGKSFIRSPPGNYAVNNVLEALACAYAVANRDSDARALMEANEKPWQGLGFASGVFIAAGGFGKGLVIAGREADAEPIFDAYGGEESSDNRMLINHIAGGLAQAYLMAGRDDDFKALLSRQGNMTDFKPRAIKSGACQGASQIGLSSISDDFLGDLKWD